MRRHFAERKTSWMWRRGNPSMNGFDSLSKFSAVQAISQSSTRQVYNFGFKGFAYLGLVVSVSHKFVNLVLSELTWMFIKHCWTCIDDGRVVHWSGRNGDWLDFNNIQVWHFLGVRRNVHGRLKGNSQIWLDLRWGQWKRLLWCNRERIPFWWQEWRVFLRANLKRRKGSGMRHFVFSKR